MKKQSVLTIIALVVLLVGIIVSFAAGELVSTKIYDPSVGTVESGIISHVLIIMLFVIVSDALLYIANRNKIAEATNKVKYYVFHGIYAVSGLLLAIATAYKARAILLNDYYYDMVYAPDFYRGDIVSYDWFNRLPKTADDFYTLFIVFLILAIVGIIGTVVLGILSYKNTTQK